MIIPRPTQNDYLTRDPLPTQEPSNRARHRAWVDYLFSLPPWKCPECNTTMFGACERCVWCWLKYRKTIPRQTDPNTARQDPAKGSP